MGFSDMAIALGAYKQNNYDAAKDGVNEYSKVTSAKTGETVFEDFDFDQNGAVDYRKGYTQTNEGVVSYEEFFNNDKENNQKIYQQEPSAIDKALRFFGIQTDKTLSDIDKDEMRAKAESIVEQYEKEQQEQEALQEQLDIIQQELETIKEKINTELDEADLNIQEEMLEKYRKQLEENMSDKFFENIPNKSSKEKSISEPEFKGLG